MQFAIKSGNGYKIASPAAVAQSVSDALGGQHPIGSIQRWSEDARNAAGVYTLISRSEPLDKYQRHAAPEIVIEGGKPVALRRAVDIALPDAKALAVNAAFEASIEALKAMVAGYAPEERDTWNVQLEEARAIDADPTAPAPFLATRAAARGIDPADLAAVVIAKNSEYRAGSGQILGQRDARLADIAAAANLTDLRAIAGL